MEFYARIIYFELVISDVITVVITEVVMTVVMMRTQSVPIEIPDFIL